METKKTISKVIPEGELNCIWAEAGLVSYKLCDRNCECDDCPFDQVMRQKVVPALASSYAVKSAASETGAKDRLKQDTLLDVIRNIFDRPLAKKIPEDRYYSAGHIWIKTVGEKVCRIGIDHYVADLLEGVGSVVLPQPGTPSVRHNPCAWIICDEGTIAVHSPVNGRIRCVNPQLMDSATLVKSDSYETGWLSDISTDEETPADCVDASTMVSRSKEQFHRLKQNIMNEFDARPPSLGVTMMDGGIRPKNLKDVLGTAEYVRFLQRLLSH